MSEEMNQGIRLAALGMGLVFSALIAFMLILFALRQFFPGEEFTPEDDEGNPDSTSPNLHKTGNGDNRMPIKNYETDPTGSNKAIVALAISTYLSMEELDTYSPNKPIYENTRSGWSKQNRTNAVEQQGTRPDSFTEKPYNTYFLQGKSRKHFV